MSEVNPGLIEENGKYIFKTSEDIVSEVGDTKQTSFYPQVKIKKWNNEVNFSLRYSSDITSANYYKDENDIVTWINKDNVKVKMYELSEANGFEFEFELPEKPNSNIFEMTIRTKGLNFYYQPELTQEEKDRGNFRPDNVIGSYAVYHQSKFDNEYKTGKAFHIERPKAIDKEYNWTWCDLNIDTNKELLTITIPQEFLNSAAYPVNVDPTFGYSSIGSATTNLAAGVQAAIYSAAAPASVSIDSITFYGGQPGGVSGTFRYFKGVIWDGTNLSSDSVSANIITNGITQSGTTPNATPAAWRTATYSSKPSVTAGTGYRLGIIPSDDTNIYYDNIGPFEYVLFLNQNYTNPTPLNRTGNSKSNALYSIYATYTLTETPSIRRQIILEGVGRGIFDGVK